MRALLVIILILFWVSSAQSYSITKGVIDGPANIRQNPNGKTLLSLNDNVEVEIISDDGTWYLIAVKVEVISSYYSSIDVIKKGEDLYTNINSIIGITKSDIIISDKWLQSITGQTFSVRIEGYTHRNNIKYTINKRPSIERPSIETIFENNKSVTKYIDQISDIYKSNKFSIVETPDYTGEEREKIFQLLRKKLQSELYAWELVLLDYPQLRLLRNEILAKKKYIFKSKDLNDYFHSFKWYKPELTSTSGIQLTDIELKNINLIKKIESVKYSKNVVSSDFLKTQ